MKVTALFSLILMFVSISCVTESDVMRNGSQAAYQAVFDGEDADFREGSILIRTMVFSEDGTLLSYTEHPPSNDVFILDWHVQFAGSGIIVTDGEDSQWKYEPSDRGMLLVEVNGREVENILYRYVGGRSSASERADSVISASYPGGVEHASLHYSDAQTLCELLRQQGFNPRIRISIAEGKTFYVLSFDGRWLGDNFESKIDQRCVSFAFSAVGLTSANTSWSSSHALVFFEDCGWSLPTTACRLLKREYGYPPAAGALHLVTDYAQFFDTGLRDY